MRSGERDGARELAPYLTCQSHTKCDHIYKYFKPLAYAEIRLTSTRVVLQACIRTKEA